MASFLNSKFFMLDDVALPSDVSILLFYLFLAIASLFLLRLFKPPFQPRTVKFDFVTVTSLNTETETVDLTPSFDITVNFRALNYERTVSYNVLEVNVGWPGKDDITLDIDVAIGNGSVNVGVIFITLRDGVSEFVKFDFVI